MEIPHAAGEPLPLDRIELDVHDLVAIVLHGAQDAVDLAGIFVFPARTGDGRSSFPIKQNTDIQVGVFNGNQVLLRYLL